MTILSLNIHNIRYRLYFQNDLIGAKVELASNLNFVSFPHADAPRPSEAGLLDIGADDSHLLRALALWDDRLVTFYLEEEQTVGKQIFDKCNAECFYMSMFMSKIHVLLNSGGLQPASKMTPFL